MPYTLVKFLVWALLLALIGGVIGWMLRSLKARADITKLRAGGGDDGEVERLRTRAAELDAVTAERDRLRMEIADVRGSSAGTLGFATTVAPEALAAMSDPDVGDEGDGDDDAPRADDAGDDDVSDAAGAADASTNDDPNGEPSSSAEGTDASAAVVGGLGTLIPAGDAADAATPGVDDEPAPIELDMEQARAELGRAVALDDLTVVEGIGPKIAELCTAIGIETWQALASTEVATLQSMLDDAGARFKMHKPQTWPEQADLLASGRWADFSALTDRLRGGS